MHYSSHFDESLYMYTNIVCKVQKWDVLITLICYCDHLDWCGTKKAFCVSKKKKFTFLSFLQECLKLEYELHTWYNSDFYKEKVKKYRGICGPIYTRNMCKMSPNVATFYTHFMGLQIPLCSVLFSYKKQCTYTYY